MNYLKLPLIPGGRYTQFKMKLLLTALIVASAFVQGTYFFIPVGKVNRVQLIYTRKGKGFGLQWRIKYLMAAFPKIAA